MMKSIIVMSIVMICMLVACSYDSEPITEDLICISAATPDFEPEIHARTSMNGSKASFTGGDVLGVFETLTGRNNVAFSYNSTSWTTSTPMYWYNGSSIHTFYAYYPYNSSSQGVTVAMPVLSLQKVSVVPDASRDMLVTSSAVTQTRNSNTSVTLNMKHAFALLRFDIKMSVLSLINPYLLDSLTVRGGNSAGSGNPYGMFNTVNNISKVNYNLSSNSINLSPSDNTTCSQLLRSAPASVNIVMTAVSVYVLVLPGTYTNPVPAVKLNLSTLGVIPKNTGFLTLPNTSSFVAGNMYVYQISIGLNPFGRAKVNASEEEGILPAEIRQFSP